MDYSDPSKIKTILEILGVNARSCEASEGRGASQENSCTVNQTISGVNTKPREAREGQGACSVNQTMSNDSEATVVAREILEERIRVAIEVCTLIHDTAETLDSENGQVIIYS